MLTDARYLHPETIETDICIIGAGPAGIGLAREFIGQKLEVALLESGGFDFDPEIQSLADGVVRGDVKAPIDVNRRQFGGNANVWHVQVGNGNVGLRHAVFDAIDFVKRDWITNSGWPFDREHLMPYYLRAQSTCQAGNFSYSPEGFEDSEVQRMTLPDADLETGIFRFSAGNVFYQHYRDELAASRNVTVYTYASVVELLAGDSGKAVTRARIARPGKSDLWISAKAFIISAGGFENARLLLMSNQQQSAGLGNQHDVVGRYYHDHLQGRSGYFTPTDSRLLGRSALYDLRQVNGSSVMGYLKLSQAIMQKHKLLNINCFLYPKPNPRQNKAIDSFNRLREVGLFSRQQGEYAAIFPKEGRAKLLLNTLFGSDYVVRMAYLAHAGRQATAYGLGNGGWSALPDVPGKFKRFEVWHSIEQSPHPDNRVTLSSQRDMYGCPKLEVRWHWPQEDIAQTLRAQTAIADALERSGLGKLQLVHDPDGLPNVVRPVGSHHLMGTTRMHDDPKLGVVNADCRVHGIANLFVAGSSTFPTGGCANPTLTIVAMALRLADLLKQEFESGALGALSRFIL